MHKFSFLGHTADVRLLLSGSSFDELFRAALLGLSELLHPSPLGADAKISQKLTVESTDKTALLIEFIAEVLAHSHIQKAIFTEVLFTKLTENQLEAVINGVKVAHFEKDVKAVTYHEASVSIHTDGLYETVVIFDI
jgi:SHS2 domain-containing protein